MSSEQNRRFFIRQFLATVGTLGGAAALSTSLSACSTLDEYLFEDHYDLKDQVLIIGGGLSGLQLAYLLKQAKTEFRLFEGSSRFGGRVRSYQNYDLGGSLFSADSKHLQLLLKDFALTSETFDKKNYFLPTGMETIVSHLVDRISGLMPYRNLRLKWRLVSIRKVNGSYNLLFDTPKGKRTFVSKRVVIAIPPSQWRSIAGLMELEDMREAREWSTALKSENIVKAIVPLPLQAKGGHLKSVIRYEDSLFDVRQVNKRGKTGSWAEVDFNFRESGESIEIQKLNEFMKRKMNLLVNYSKLGTENYFDWRETKLIGGAYFRNALPWPESKKTYFQVIGDFANSQNPYTMEGALSAAAAAAEKLI